MSKERDAMTKEAEERIMQVSELITDNMMATFVEFPYSGMVPNTENIEGALNILAPQTDEQTGVAKYIIGIVVGLHVAGRTDLIPKFARAYAATAEFPMEADANEEGIPATH
jgi:hypothetical protein